MQFAARSVLVVVRVALEWSCQCWRGGVRVLKPGKEPCPFELRDTPLGPHFYLETLHLLARFLLLACPTPQGYELLLRLTRFAVLGLCIDKVHYCLCIAS